MYDDILSEHIKELFGHKEFDAHSLKSKVIWAELKKKFNVFYLHKPYWKQTIDAQALKQWREALGKERILPMKTPKACVDVMLGAIAITSGRRTLETYIEDMKERGQDAERI